MVCPHLGNDVPITWNPWLTWSQLFHSYYLNAIRWSQTFPGPAHPLTAHWLPSHIPNHPLPSLNPHASFLKPMQMLVPCCRGQIWLLLVNTLPCTDLQIPTLPQMRLTEFCNSSGPEHETCTGPTKSWVCILNLDFKTVWIVKQTVNT